MNEFITAIQSADSIATANQTYYTAVDMFGYSADLWVALTEKVFAIRQEISK